MKTDTEINPQEKHQNKTNQQQNISQQKPGLMITTNKFLLLILHDTIKTLSW